MVLGDVGGKCLKCGKECGQQFYYLDLPWRGRLTPFCSKECMAPFEGVPVANAGSLIWGASGGFEYTMANIESKRTPEDRSDGRYFIHSDLEMAGKQPDGEMTTKNHYRVTWKER